MHFIKANSTKVFDNTQHCHVMNIEAAMLKVAMAQGGNKSAGLKDNFQQGDSYEQYQYFYHPDHLGSSSFITNTDGEVVQHIEYVPYGEVFIEERNNVWNTPYLFNAKEFDEETGLYYYGARYYDSRLAIFTQLIGMQRNILGNRHIAMLVKILLEILMLMGIV